MQLRPADVGDADDGEGGEEKGGEGDGGVGGGLTKSGRVVRKPSSMLCFHVRRVVFHGSCALEICHEAYRG